MAARRFSRACSFALFCTVAAMSVVACDSSDDGSQAAGVVLYPTTKVLDEGTLARIIEASPDLGRLVFSGSTGLLDGVAVGDVLLGGVSAKTPNGLLRRVTAKANEGGAFVLTTTRAALTDAIERGTITMPRTTLTRASATGEAAPGARIQALHPLDTGASTLGQEFTVGIDAISLVPGLTAGASLGFGIGADLSMTIDTKRIEGKLVLSASESATIDVRALVSAEVDKRYKIATFLFPPIPITIGGIPIVISTKLTVDVGVRGKVSGSVGWSAKEDAKMDVGLVLSSKDGLDTIFEGTATGRLDPIMATASASLDAFAGLTLEASVNAPIADASFRVGADGYVRVGTSTEASPCSYLGSAGVEGRVGIDASLLGFTIADEEKTKDLYSLKIGEGVCSTDPTGSTGWAAVIAASDLERDPSIDLLPDGSVFVASNSSGVVGYAARLASKASPVWEKKLDGSVVLSRLLARPDGGSWIVGKNGSVPAFALADNGGERVAMKELVVAAGGPSLGGVIAEKTKDGGFLVGGSALEGSTFVHWAAKVDAAGEIAWARTYDGLAGEPFAIAEGNDGGALLVGVESSGSTAQTLVLRTNPDGSVRFARTYGDGRLYGVTAFSAGGFAAVGQTATGHGAIVLRLTDEGAPTFGFSYGDEAPSGPEFRGNAVAERPDGILVVGMRGFASASDGWALAVGPAGELGFSRSYGGSLADNFRGVRVAKDGTAFVVGETQSFGATSKLLTARVSPSGALAFTAASGAVLSNVSGVKATLPGSEASKSATAKPLALTIRAATPPDWDFKSIAAPKRPLAP
jgi:hypothetical protein